MWKSTKKKTTKTHIFTMLLFMSVFLTWGLKAEHHDSPTRSAVSGQCLALSTSSSLFSCQNPHLTYVSQEMIRLMQMAVKAVSSGKAAWQTNSSGCPKEIMECQSCWVLLEKGNSVVDMFGGYHTGPQSFIYNVEVQKVLKTKFLITQGKA